jgi:hexosaminidase
MIDVAWDVQVEGSDIRCTICTNTDLDAPVLCFSLMAPPASGAGCTLIHSDGGYAEVQLPDLRAGVPHTLVLNYANPDFRPVNRAWLPLGSYLRTQTGIITLPVLPAGVAPGPEQQSTPPKDLCLIPDPMQWEPKEGQLDFNGVALHDDLWAGVETLARRCNLPSFFNKDGISTALHPDPDLHNDAYRIDIRADRIIVHYGGPVGAHYAGISLLMLRSTHNRSLPCGLITDQPRFGWRGQHLDCARHFFAPDTIHQLIDLMALLKLNRFHWHFSDDEAFRLEVNCAPSLWQKTCWRGENQLIPGVFGGGVKAGGSYSIEQAKAIVKHASQYHIEVLPEVEFPAHALAVARAFPETRDPNDIGLEQSVQGYDKNVLNPAMPATWALMEAVTDEVTDIFPFSMLHLGADELPEGTWAGSPAVTALKRDHDLQTTDDVQGWSLARLASRLKENGIRPAAWEEAARGKNGGIGNEAVLFSWTGQAAGISAARNGYDIVMCPAQHVYLDMAHTDRPDDWGAAWAAFISLEDTVNWTVIPDPSIADRIIGVQGTFWSEFTTSDTEIQPMIAPRIFGIATKGWCHTDEVEPQRLKLASSRLCTLLSAMNWRWNPACFD